MHFFLVKELWVSVLFNHSALEHFSVVKGPIAQGDWGGLEVGLVRQWYNYIDLMVKKLKACLHSYLFHIKPMCPIG